MRYSITIFLVFIFFAGIAQTVPQGNPSVFNTGRYKIGWLQSDSGLIVAYRDTLFLPRYNGTTVMRPQDRHFYYYDSVLLKWIKLLSSGDVASVIAGQGLSTQNDSVQFGQPLNSIGNPSAITNARYIKLNNTLGTDQINSGAIILGNMDAAANAYAGFWNDYVSGNFQTGLIYGHRGNSFDSLRNVQYGGMITLLNEINTDSNNILFQGANSLTPGIQGIYVTGRLHPAKNEQIASGISGTSAALFRGSFDVGSFNAYNINVISAATRPNFPLASFHSSMDLDRESNAQTRTITGNGIANFLADIRSYQSNIGSGTTNYGSRMGKIIDFASYGLALDHSESPSKSKTLAVSEIDSLFSFLSFPKWKPKNEALNGYSYVSFGDSDRAFIQGTMRIGGILPAVVNGGQSYKFEVLDTTTLKTASTNLVRISDSTSTFNTTSAAVINQLAYIGITGTRSSGSNTLTNVGLHIKSTGGQDTVAAWLERGDLRLGDVLTNKSAYFSSFHTQDITSATNATAKKADFYGEMHRIYEDSVNLPTDTYGMRLLTFLEPASGLSLSNNFRSGAEIGLFLSKKTGTAAITNYVGKTTPAGGASTMPSAFVSRLSASDAWSTGQELKTSGFFASFSAFVALSTGNQLDKVAWINTGAAQSTAGGSIITGYGLYVNVLGGAVGAAITNRYAIFQEGTIDTNSYAGISRFTGNIYSEATLAGGFKSGDSLKLTASTNATKGKIKFGSLDYYDETAHLLSIGDGLTNAAANIVLNSTTSGGITFAGFARTMSVPVSFTVVQPSAMSATGNDWFTYSNPNFAQTSGTQKGIKLLFTFGPTSGNAVFNVEEHNETIGQTGGASGITRSLYINPVITAAADYRSIEVARGHVVINDSLQVSYFRAGTSADSVVVHDAVTGAFKLRAASAFSGGGGGTGFGIDSTVISGTSGSVLYVGTGNKLRQSNANLFYDSTNIRLGIGTNTPARTLHSTLNDAATNTVTYPFRITHATSGTATTSFGVGLEFEQENASGTNKIVGTIETPFTTATNGSETATMAFMLVNSGTLASRMTLTAQGNLTASGSIASTTQITTGTNFILPATGIVAWTSRSFVSSPADGIVLLQNNAQNNFTRLDFGGTTSSFPALSRNSDTLQVVLADGTTTGKLKTSIFYSTGTVKMDAMQVGIGTNPLLVKGADSVVRQISGGAFLSSNNITSSTFTPTTSGGVNVAANTPQQGFYIRNGNIVIYYGTISIDASTLGTQTNLELSLPFASDLTTSVDLAGTIQTNDSGDQTYGVIFGSAANNTAVLSFIAGTTGGNATYRFSFSYIIK